MPKLGKEEYLEHIKGRLIQPPQYVYKYTSTESAKIILQTGKLRFQSPKNFNDPLDSQWNVFWPMSAPWAIEYEASLVRQALIRDDAWPEDCSMDMRRAMRVCRRDMRSVLAHRRAAWINEFVSDCVSNRSGEQYADLRMKDLVLRMRICCVSESWQSLPMWAHYAGDGSGVVLCFDSRRLEDGYSIPLERVEYLDKYPDLINAKEFIRHLVFGTSTRTASEAGRRWALIKGKNWEYEQEWRLMFGLEDHSRDLWSDCNFVDGSLVRVILGYRSNSSGNAEIVRMCESGGIALCRAQFNSLTHELMQVAL